MEHWRSVRGFSDYLVSDQGNVFNIRFQTEVATVLNQDKNYLYVNLREQGRRYVRGVSKLVAEAWVDRPRATFDTVVHLDYNFRNVSAENLVWRPRWFAINYHRQIEWFKNPPRYKLELIETGEVGDIYHFASKYGMLLHEISSNASNRQEISVFPHFVNFRFVYE